MLARAAMKPHICMYEGSERRRSSEQAARWVWQAHNTHASAGFGSRHSILIRFTPILVGGSRARRDATLQPVAALRPGCFDGGSPRGYGVATTGNADDDGCRGRGPRSQGARSPHGPLMGGCDAPMLLIDKTAAAPPKSPPSATAASASAGSAPSAGSPSMPLPRRSSTKQYVMRSPSNETTAHATIVFPRPMALFSGTNAAEPIVAPSLPHAAEKPFRVVRLRQERGREGQRGGRHRHRDTDTDTDMEGEEGGRWDC